MNITELYQTIISDLKKDKRALVSIRASQTQELLSSWEKGLGPGQLNQLLCILDHMTTGSILFAPLIEQELEKESDHDTLIYLLGASQKHIIEAAAKTGSPPRGSFMTILKELLSSPASKDPEVFEWLLRTIEQTGMKSIFFKAEILKRRPRVGHIFNQHKRSCKEIIELLERRWAPISGGPLG